jgi:LPXTG-motif cell wall-anchored protein
MLYTDDGFDNVFGTTDTEPAEPVTDTEDVTDSTPETTGAPETDAQPEKKSGDRTALIVAIVAGVTVLAGAGVFLLIKKKK